MNRLSGVVRNGKGAHFDRVDCKMVMAVEPEHARQRGKTLGDGGQRAERQPDRRLVPCRECRHAADMIAVLVGDDDRGDAFRFNAQAGKARDRVADAEAAVDQHAGAAAFDQQAVALAAAAETRETHRG